MTEGVENQEVSYLHSSYVMARSNLLVPAERKKNFTFSLSFREGRIREILLIAAFFRKA